jgi:hypothetical protein
MLCDLSPMGLSAWPRSGNLQTMATNRRTGRPTSKSKTQSTKGSKGGASTGSGALPPGVDPNFVAEWNALDKPTRRQVRRLVRIGRQQENAEDARLAVGFAAYQRTRPWYRYFWFWIIPLLVAGVIAGFALHPILIGVVLAVCGNAVLVRRGFSKADWLNEPLLGG